MANDFDDQIRSRSAQRSKRRKTNIILNSLILVVVVLIIIVGSKIFLGGNDDDKKAAIDKNKETEQAKGIHDSKDNKNNNSENKDRVTSDNDTNEDQDDNDELSSEDEKQDLDGEDLNSEEVISQESDEPNVKKSYTNPNWKGIGTEQTNGHQYSSDQNSIDWQEKTRALSYATGIPEESLTIWYLGREGGSDNLVAGTVSSKNDPSKTYRVYLSWEDGQGWKPIKVLELNKNDKR
ncbi:DUF1510 family protein [Heyndrickxia sp. FSL K6-6286]|uniref:DUF1510 family protein n=1 Tax=Heyndrickxia oleronia TaxID=38875 RepID=A0AAW6STR0_9BACI|nr:YrrS family protein [Heyndrickxia oleronia]MDH5160216.1 DUF1510 family protein [Heyndrickxia oleronia]